MKDQGEEEPAKRREKGGGGRKKSKRGRMVKKIDRGNKKKEYG